MHAVIVARSPAATITEITSFRIMTAILQLGAEDVSAYWFLRHCWDRTAEVQLGLTRRRDDAKLIVLELTEFTAKGSEV